MGWVEIGARIGASPGNLLCSKKNVVYPALDPNTVRSGSVDWLIMRGQGRKGGVMNILAEAISRDDNVIWVGDFLMARVLLKTTGVKTWLTKSQDISNRERVDRALDRILDSVNSLTD